MNCGKHSSKHCAIMQLIFLLTDSTIDTTPEPGNVVALKQMIVQLFLVELEAVTSSVDDASSFSSTACDSSGAHVVADFNTDAFTEWDFLLGALSSTSTSSTERFFIKYRHAVGSKNCGTLSALPICLSTTLISCLT